MIKNLHFNRSLTRSLATLALVIFMLTPGWGQTTINFDNASNWTAGTVALISYASNHTYVDGIFSSTGGPALRNTTSSQDGFPGALGTYSWRLENNVNVDWRITISSGGVSTFSIKIRRWDNSPSPNFNLEYSLNGGSNWSLVALIDNTSLGNSSGWSTFNGTINSSNANILIRLKANGTTERIMIDDFVWTGYASSGPSLSISGTTSHGSVCPNTSANPITYTITNNGGVQAEGVTVNSNNTEFAVSGLSSTTIAAGGSATYNVTFTPSSSGSKTATITVASTTAGSNSPSSALTGTGLSSVNQALSTVAASSVTGTTATLNGNLTTLGVCPATIEKGFVYSVTSINNNPSVGGAGVTKTSVAGLNTGTFNLPLTSLPNGTGYSFKAYVYNGTAYTYGDVLLFTTSTPPANDLCGNATAINIGASALNGTLVSSTYTSPFSKKDVWYSFTPEYAGTFSIVVDAFTGDIDVEVFAATCPTTTTSLYSSATSNIPEVLTQSFAANTTYFVRVLAYNAAAESSVFTIGVYPPAPNAPVATAATNVTSTGFTANWNASSSAYGYDLDVYTLTSGSANITEGFNNGSSAPTGWTFTGITSTYTTSGNYGISSPSLKIDDSNDQIITPTFSGSASSLSFWIKGQATDASSALLVEGFNGTTWVTIQNITASIPTTGTIYTYNAGSTPALPSDMIQFRFTYTKSVGNLSFDDVSISYSSNVPSYVTGFNNLNVGNVNSYNVAVLNPTTTYYYIVRAANSGGTSANSNEISVATLSPAPTSTTFTGTGNWTDPERWDPGVPDPTSEAIIDGTATITTAVEVTNLTINNSQQLTIGGTGSLTVSGILTNNAGNSGLVIESGGSLIENTPGVAATVKRDITNNTWHLISVPNNNTKASSFMNDYLQTWDESTSDWTDITDPETSLIKGKGYGLWSVSGATESVFSGALNTGDVNYSVTLSATSGDNKGANLLGNPYPCFIDWDGLQSELGSVYYWNGSAYVSYSAETGLGDGSRYVPPMQGFFVIAPSAKTVTLTDDNKAHSSPNYYKSSSGLSSNTLVLATMGESYSDKLFINFNPEASNDYDLLYDAYKILAYTPGQSELYSYNGDKKMSIDVRPEREVIQLGFRNDQSGNYQIGISDFADINVAYIEDTKTKTYHDLFTGPYAFDYTAGESEQRLLLHFGTTSIPENGSSLKTNIYSYQQTVYVNLADNTQGDIYVYNLAGQLVTAKESASGSVRIGLTSTGVYMVKVVTQKETLTQKVVIR